MKININHYKNDLKIDVKNQNIFSNINLTYYGKNENEKEISFYLHRDLDIKNIKCSEMDKYTFEFPANGYQFLPEAKKLKIHLKKGLQRGEKLNIEFIYSGQLDIVSQWETNRITENWIELGMYSPWFPLVEDNGVFTYTVNLEIDSRYSITGNGKVKKNRKYWTIKNEEGDFDCIIVGSKDLKVKQILRDKVSIKVYYTDVIDQYVVNHTTNTAHTILQLFSDLFGMAINQEMKIVYAKREKGGGYARKGFIILSSQTIDKLTRFRSLAHELAHLWWCNAPTNTWEDWLNESFAEYSAMIAIRRQFGKKSFNKFIKSKQESMEGLPPIKGMYRSHEKAYPVLYDKGCVLLYELESEIGFDKFRLLLMLMNEEKIKSTKDFLQLLVKVSNKEVAKNFQEKLTK